MPDIAAILRDRLYRSIAIAALLLIAGAALGIAYISLMAAPTDADRLQRASIVVNILYTLLTGLLVLGAMVGLRVTARAAADQVRALRQIKDAELASEDERRTAMRTMIGIEVERIAGLRALLIRQLELVEQAAEPDRSKVARTAYRVYVRATPRMEFDPAFLTPGFLLALSPGEMADLAEIRAHLASNARAGRDFHEVVTTQLNTNSTNRHIKAALAFLHELMGNSADFERRRAALEAALPGPKAVNAV